MNPYVNELTASRACEGDTRQVVWLSDSGQMGTDVYWCQPIGKWVCVSLDSAPQMVTAEDVALVRLHKDADHDDGLSQRSLACDCERENGFWLIDAEDLEQLVRHYGAALVVLWSSKSAAASSC